MRLKGLKFYSNSPPGYLSQIVIFLGQKSNDRLSAVYYCYYQYSQSLITKSIAVHANQNRVHRDVLSLIQISLSFLNLAPMGESFWYKLEIISKRLKLQLLKWDTAVFQQRQGSNNLSQVPPREHLRQTLRDTVRGETLIIFVFRIIRALLMRKSTLLYCLQTVESALNLTDFHRECFKFN